MTRWSLLPLWVVVGLYGLTGPSSIVAALMAIAALLPQLFRWRARAGATVQVLVGLVLFGGATAMFATLLVRHPGDTESLPTAWAAFVGATLLVCIARAYVEKPVAGEPLSLALGLAALTGCGRVFSDRLYPAAVVAFLLAALVARRQADPTRTPLGTLLRTRAPALAVMLLATLAVAYLLAQTLPLGHAWVVRQVIARLTPKAGFSEQLWLGSMRGLLRSSVVVMRVRGGEGDHLRGVVFNRYDPGRWSRVRPTFRTIETAKELPHSAEAVEIEMIDDEPQHYFVPLWAQDIVFSSGLASVEPAGLYEAIQAEPAKRIYFRPSRAGAARVAPAERQDVLLPRRLLLPLQRIANEWTSGAQTDLAKLELLAHRLQRDFTYSLDFERSGSGDPVLEFLRESRRGHCEYFAAAMALLARSLGIPARVVGGYRVAEKNPLSGYYIVRERHAHAWVEAYAGGWLTFDPTAPEDLAHAAPTTTPLPLALIDLLANAWSQFLTWLDRRTVVEALGAPLLVVILALLLVWLRQRRRRRLVRTAATDEPLACFRELCGALAKRGLLRRPDETIERLAKRAEASNLPEQLRDQAAELLRCYGALRYGGGGDEKKLTGRVDDFVIACKAHSR